MFFKPSNVGHAALVRTFGVEIEFFVQQSAVAGTLPQQANKVVAAVRAAGLQVADFTGYTHNVIPQWKVVTDSTCGESNGEMGLELVSPPLRGAAGLWEVEVALQALRTLGAKVNKRCGLHVHVGVADMTADNIKNIAKIYMKSEDTLDSMVAPSRRGHQNQWSKGWAFHSDTLDREGVVRNLFAQVDNSGGTRENMARSHIFGDRYRKLSLTGNTLRYGTVEFRHHQGTLNYRKVEAWVLVCLTVVRMANMDGAPRVAGANDSRKTMFRRLTLGFRGLTDYYAKRIEEFNANGDEND